MPSLIFEDKFDTGGTYTTTAGSPTIGTSPHPPSAANSLQLNAIGEYVIWEIPNSGFTRIVFGVWVYCAAWPTTIDTKIFKIDSGPSEGWMYMNTGSEPFISSAGVPNMASVYYGSTLATSTWHWVQLMYDVSANPWTLTLRVGAGTTITTSAAAAASILDTGNFMLGNTTGGNTLTVYYGHAKGGVAADDNDWWDIPTLSAGTTTRNMTLLGVG